MVILISLVIMYVVLVIFCARRMARYFELVLREKFFKANREHEKILKKKSDLCAEKIKLQSRAFEIFTLYEITREITRSSSEQEAFDIFKQKLRAQVVFEECRFVHAFSVEISTLKKSDDYFVFTLQEKRRRIGYLVIKGISEEGKEKVRIMGHQFALALRCVKLYNEIEKIAITDNLTEVYTRRYALGRLQEEVNRSKARNMRMSFFMIDVDNFKTFNDTYGHLAGDRILREIGTIIKNNIREIDIAGRYGGEEFCVVLPDTNRTGARFAAERIRQAAEKACIQAYDARVKVTLSVGVASFPVNGVSVKELVDNADIALYRAKKQGRNRICFFC